MNKSSYEPEAGKSFAEKIDALKKDLDTIEAHHQDFFGPRGDRLADHYIFDDDITKRGFRFQQDSDLPDAIKEECLRAYEKAFGGKD
ncbi:hypothetical protein GA0116948_111113 [Chitinophaga costaii]|uniref:Uncharacterized protein n=1 Tax=Chitinophaga costaii TaxID=1335309 RepID=A0A1C4F4B7_9BACT|nr:hypothetical protein [Chitinophaga costaii]SCC50694.1 hypothetical protein GA0116948_111113 [Chitinophaga costaii]